MMAQEEEIVDASPTCTHHWIIEMQSINGVYPSRCKLCGEHKDFINAVNANARYPTRSEIKNKNQEGGNRSTRRDNNIPPYDNTGKSIRHSGMD